MNILNMLAQQPGNQTKTSISSNSLGIILAIIFILFLVIMIFVAFKDTGTKDASEDENKKKKHIPLGVIFTIFCLFLIIGVPLILITNNNNSSKSSGLITRNIRKSDYTYTTSQDLTSYSITIVPELNFNTCTIELTLYNSQNKKIFADTLTKSNLKKNSSYTYTFQFGFINSLSGDNVTFEVSGKCSTFQ